ncbi:MAG: hypothetical protein LC102_00925 [Ignavibacteriales bacterium]|nr:MAG: hypothetical protein F9K26_03360 [Ignavibacteriaceae bacterium]MBW7872471.1 hypothetical protein [Ignavibacteria bacterium]MCZ2141976.1 hypothetical protein [Ignavibacteriales bacterium]OQY70348.1 MAG: hypothetical protein B6D45_11345 [Ignavibacteriales bacterium UTCHB3]MBV6445142.1 hypothetical protein [Ignavibacteriaceae bacterium]
MPKEKLIKIMLAVVGGILIVIVGLIFIFKGSEYSKKQQIKDECEFLAKDAQKYYQKPASMGGGSNSFVGWFISINLDTTKAAVYKVVSADLNEVRVSATGIVKGNDKDTIKMLLVIRPEDYTISTVENNDASGVKNNDASGQAN